MLRLHIASRATVALIVLAGALTGLVGPRPGPAAANDWSENLHIFGYLQAQWYSQTRIHTDETVNSFNLQQLNLMAQRGIGDEFSAFLNIEMINSFNSQQNWGSIRVEEAWVRWRPSHKFQLKMGLLIPTFNRFNEIKNRTPILPYVIRPIVYEASFAGDIPLEEYVPQRAYLQAYGYFPVGVKLDYAVYLGNTADTNRNPRNGITGVDTTASVMVGGRVGARLREFQLGFSFTHQPVSFFQGLEDTLGGGADRFDSIAQRRIGVDFSFQVWRFNFESEYINVMYDEDAPEINVDKQFGYYTIGYQISERWHIYLSQWILQEYRNDLLAPQKITINIPNFGASFTMNDRITFKAQVGSGEFETDTGEDISDQNFDFFTMAVSVFF
jgi:hypothetical protein